MRLVSLSLCLLVAACNRQLPTTEPAPVISEAPPSKKPVGERLDIMPRLAWSLGNLKPGDTVALKFGLVALSPEAYREWKESGRFSTTVRLEKEKKLLVLPNGTRATFLGADNGRYHLRIAEGNSSGTECYTDEISIGEPKRKSR